MADARLTQTGHDVRILLSDDGEGWLANAPCALAGSVVGEASAEVGEPFTKVEFDSPIRLQEGSGLPFFGWRTCVYVGAWVQPHLVGDAISDRTPVSVRMWLVSQESSWGEPPAESPGFRARCTVLA